MKLILCTGLCLLWVAGFCQVKVGVQAGYNYATFSGKDIQPISDYYYHASGQPAFNAGITSSIPLFKRISLQPSLLLSEKGTKETSAGFRTSYYYTHLRIYYAHLPMQVMYTVVSSRQWQVSAGGGFFVSKGLWGTSRTHVAASNDSIAILTSPATRVRFTNDLYNYDSDRRNIKPWDYGYTIAAAAGWQNWQLKASYDFGLVNMVEQEPHKTGVFSLSAGYYFWGKKEKRAKN